MRSLTLIAAFSCLCAAGFAANQRSGSSEGLSEYESFTSALSENNKGLPLKDIRTVGGKRAPLQRSNIVYGKGRHAEQPKFTRHHYHPTTAKPKLQSSKFNPSPEDSFETEGSSQNFKLNNPDSALLQKYMQKYAQQLYAAQKHAAQLSESQKYVLGQDAYTKKFAPAPQAAKYTAPKFIPLTSSFEGGKATSSQSFTNFGDETSKEAVEPITEKYQNFASQNQNFGSQNQNLGNQNFAVAQKLVVQASKPSVTKTFPKKTYSSYSYSDSTPQGTDFKFNNLYENSLEPQLVNQYLYGSQDRESLAGYEAYAHYAGGVTDKAEAPIPKITGYKIPGAVSLSLGHQFEEKGHHEHGHQEQGHHEEHYPVAEPKYEFMYQVKDPEKHNHFGHSEARKGKTTWGKYYVQLPDGRLETVKYYADKTGYHAEVDFKGHAKHPPAKEHHPVHHHHHGHLDRLEDGSGGLGTSYVGHSFKNEAGLSSHQDYSIAEQAEEYQ